MQKSTKQHIRTLNEFKQVLSRLKLIKLKGLEEYSTDDLFYVPVFQYMRGIGSDISTKGFILSLIADSSRYGVSGMKGEVLIFHSARYAKRRDFSLMIDNLSNCIEGDCLLISGKPEWHYSSRTIQSSKYVMIWYRQLHSSGIEFSLANRIIPYAVRALAFHRFCQELRGQIGHVKLAIVVADQDYDDYQFLCMCRSKGITTATLQHGFFPGKGIQDDLSKLSVFYEHNNTDYFFSWGPLSTKRALACGIDRNSLIAAGNPKFINRDIRRDLDFYGTLKGKFIVVLNGGSAYDCADNLEMIALAVKISNQLGLRCQFKLHPADGSFKETVQSIIGSNCSILEDGVDIDACVERCDFMIASKSSSYAELLYYGAVVFRYVKDPAQDLYAGIDIGVFNSESGLIDLIYDFYMDPFELSTRFRYSVSQLFYDNELERYRSAIAALLEDVRCEK